MNLKWFLYGALFFLAAHVVTWFQLNGQFIWKYCKDNPLILSFVHLLRTSSFSSPVLFSDILSNPKTK